MGERPCQREGLAAREGEIPDAAEAVWQVCQREGCAIFERVVTDAGEAVRQASQRDGFAADVGDSVHQQIGAMSPHTPVEEKSVLNSTL